MKRYYCRHLSLLIATTLTWRGFSHALTVEVLDMDELRDADGSPMGGLGPVVAEADTHITLINIVNDYLWFGLAVVALGVLVYAGIRLMTARGDQAVMQKTNQALIGVGIGLAIAIFSYTIIRMVANLF